MCLNPQSIFNRSTFVNRHSGSLLMNVPCCKCSECLSLKQDEWTLRSFYEWKEVEKAHGIALFDTLTYNPESMDKRMFYGIPRFSKVDVRYFFHKLRNRLKKSGITFRYLLTCEYGELLHRPHYHVLFFIYPPIDKFITATSLALRFHAAVSASWTEPKLNKDGEIAYRLIKGRKSIIMRSLGFHDLRQECLNHIIKNVAGLRYVSKYITKDDEYYKQLGIIKDAILNGMNYEPVINEVHQAYKEAKPFHVQSLGYGASAIDEIKQILSENSNADSITNIAISKEPIKIPMYYLRKIFYKLVSTGIKPDGKPYYSWRLTEVGKLFKVNQLERRISRFTLKYQNLIDNADVYDFENANIFKDQIKTLLGNRSLEKFTIYKHIYKGHYNNDQPFVVNPNDYLSFFMSSLDSGDEESYLYHQDYSTRLRFRKQELRNVIDESYNIQWQNFDSIDALLQKLLTKKQIYKSLKESNKKDRIKRLSLLKPSKYNYYVNVKRKTKETSSY